MSLTLLETWETGFLLQVPYYQVFVCLQFGGFSAESLADRILDAKCEVVITAGLLTP